MKKVGVTELDLVAEVERLKVTGYKNVKPGTPLAKYLAPVKDLDRFNNAVARRKVWMNNPDTPLKLPGKIEKIDPVDELLDNFDVRREDLYRYLYQ